MKYESLPISEWAKLLTEKPEVELSTTRGIYKLCGFKYYRNNQWGLLLYDISGSGNWYNLDEEILPMRPVLQRDRSVKFYKEIPEYRPFTSCEFIKYLESTQGKLNIRFKDGTYWYQEYRLNFKNDCMQVDIAGVSYTLEALFEKIVFVNSESKEEIVFGMMY